MNQLVGQMLSDLGGAASVAMVRMGDSLGLYRILHEKGGMTCEDLAAAAGVHERYLREWLSHQAASNYLAYDPERKILSLPPEQAMLFAIEDSPMTMLGAFDNVAAWGRTIESTGGVPERWRARLQGYACCRGLKSRPKSTHRGGATRHQERWSAWCKLPMNSATGFPA